ncbi:MAG: choice-of-anchor D domain-containing protein, partial [Deltaproteobacteria bacterium]|nr:choice-of-anchor D domain-containing protein [Deltaproteobacteria bacterium]
MKRMSVLSLFFAFIITSCGGGGFTPGQDINILIEPSSISFGTVKIGDVVEQNVKIKNIGSEGVLKLPKTYLSDKSSKEFTFDGPYKTELNPSESTMVKVIYTPQDSGSDTGELVMEHNVPPKYKSIVTLSSLSQLPFITVVPDPIDFGSVSHGDSKELP